MANTSNLGFNAGPGTLGGYKFEPIRQMNWELIVFNYANFDKIRLALKTCDRPTVTQDAIEVHHFNDRFYLSGKTVYNEFKCSAYEAIPESVSGYYVSEMMQDWKHLMFDPKTNIMLPGSAYKKDGLLTLYDGQGIEQFSYTMLGIWPKDIAPSGLDYTSAESATVEITFKVDKCFINTR